MATRQILEKIISISRDKNSGRVRFELEGGHTVLLCSNAADIVALSADVGDMFVADLSRLAETPSLVRITFMRGSRVRPIGGYTADAFSSDHPIMDAL